MSAVDRSLELAHDIPALHGLEADCWPPCRPIETYQDGTWAPAEDGIFAALLPVYDEDDEIIDIVAWELLGPGSPWWLRRGVVTHLGARWLQRVASRQRPLRLVATPREWLQDRGEAVCILDWRANVRDLLATVPEVICTRPALKARLEQALAQPLRTPRVL